MSRRERRAAAGASQAKPNSADGSAAAALYATGLGHLQAGRHLDAQISCQQALAAETDHADSLHLMGLLSIETRQLDHAVEWIIRAIRQDPKPEYLSSLGSTLRQQGRHEEAFKTFEKAVQLKPDDAELWASLGKTLVELQRPAEALLSFQHALTLDPPRWDAACQCGILLYQSRRLEEALGAFDLCDHLQPNHLWTVYIRAVILRDLGRSEQALVESRRAHALDPDNADPNNLVGNLLHSLGRHEEALQWFDRALAIRPDLVEALYNKAVSLGKIRRFDEALAIYQRLKTFGPNNTMTDWNLAVLLQELGRPEEALVYFNRCDQREPNSALMLHKRAISLRDLKRFEEALDDNRRSYALDPTNADTCNNTGTVLHSLDRDEEALQWYDRALQLRPGFTVALNNKAASLGHARRFDDCFSTYALLKAIDPENADADWNLALIHLRAGNFGAGWAGREVRWRVPLLSSSYPKLTQPLWLGEGAIEGKTIFIWSDEGFGDTIQFARYVPLLAARGARVILSVPNPTVPLLSGLPGVSQCIPSSVRARLAFDIHCPIGSLPFAFRTELGTIPSSTSYLPPPAEVRRQVWEDRLGPHDKLRVGLVWSGNPEHGNDQNRSSSLRTFSALLDVDATFVSLQKDPRPGDRAALLERCDIVDLTAHLTDFVETAALVSCLDLVITVDTSVAHLAGALGSPTWILLPYTPDWRWLLDRDDSPWYPTVRLFRQGPSRDYVEVIDRVRAELAAMAAGYQPAKA